MLPMCFLGKPSPTSNVFTHEAGFLMLQEPRVVEKTLTDGLGSLQSEPSRLNRVFHVIVHPQRTMGPTVLQTESLSCDEVVP